jgi:tetratricopeptide (TPR) repeat protein
LSTLFGLLSLIFYADYARQRSTPSDPPAVPAPFPGSAVLDYALALLFLALGLMSKPMLVTWPCVMLLLDYWPLGRIAEFGVRSAEWERRSLRRESWKSLVREKIPFFALALITSVLTFVAQKHGGAMSASADSSTFRVRCGNALVSCCRYLAKMLWPAHLAVPYLHAGEWPAWQVLLAGAFILGVSMLLFRQRRRHPFLLMGWLWYGGTLLPVIGLVQVGDQSMADRYTYIPSLGVLILAAWGTYELVRSWRYQAIALPAAGAMALVLCAGLTRQQTGYWKDSETLFRHTVELAEDNFVAHNDLGVALDDQGRIDEAIRQFQTAVRLAPDYPDAHANLGSALFKNGQIDEAIRQYQEALGLKADNARTFYNLGTALYAKGRIDESIREFQEALRFKPDYAEAHSNLGSALYRSGQINEAIQQFQEALRLKPDYAEIHNCLGVAFGTQGRIDEAIGQFQEGVRLKPDYTEARNNLAKTLEMKKAPAGR